MFEKFIKFMSGEKFMQQVIRRNTWLLLFPILSLVLSACSNPTEIALPVISRPTPTPTEEPVAPTDMPPPPKTLVMCLGREPDSLFIYGDLQPEADTILQAIYDGPVDVRNFTYEPVIFSKLPSFEDGDARIEEVSVKEGEVYLNPLTQAPEILTPLKPYLPPGCHQGDCVQTFSEGEVIMDRLVVEFEILPEVLWSDGEPVKASDSVFSFHIDSDQDMPTTKYLVHRTSSYVALDEQRVQWTGIPGFLDPEFESNFWSPLPEHVLGSHEVADLVTLEEASRFPIGWGPYEIVSWEPGSEIVMQRSETYFRSVEGLPAFDLVRFRFLGLDYLLALEQGLTGECDILDESILHASQWGNAVALADGGRLGVAAVEGMVMERIDFNLSPASPSPSPFLLADVRTRQAIAACIDREGLAEEASLGFSIVEESYLPSAHPDYFVDPEGTNLSASEAMDLLELVGWHDEDGDPSTPRVAKAIPGVIDGTALALNFLTTDDEMHQLIAERLIEDLSQCGVQLEVEFGDPEELFTPWPNGPIFGGRFDLVGWAWPVFTSPPCEMFAGFETPSADYVFGINASGYKNADYDRSCQRILLGPRLGEDYTNAVQETQKLLQSDVPFIPLFMRPRVIAFGSEMCGVELDPTTFSALWNIEEFDRGEDCID
jgi:peptide/nickel transport system substrate-binding protein